MDEKLWLAISALNDIRTAIHPRVAVHVNLSFEYIRQDDPWVIAALNCSDDKDIPEMALLAFVGDIKAGLYDDNQFDPPASP
jgi:hypothetical protein